MGEVLEESKFETQAHDGAGLLLYRPRCHSWPTLK